MIRRNRFPIHGLFLLIVAGAVPAFAQGGPPLIGDDPGTPGNRNWEINIGYPYLSSGAQTAMDLGQLDLNYGLGDHIELSYLGGWLAGHANGKGWQDGYDNSEFGAKWRFLDQDKSGVDMSVYPQIGFNTTRGLTQNDLTDSGLDFFAPFEIARTIGKVELDFEAGFQYVQFERDQWDGGPIIGYLLTDQIELLGEARGEFDYAFRDNNVILDGGGRFSLNDHMQILFAAGRGVRHDDQSPRLYLYAGMGFTF